MTQSAIESYIEKIVREVVTGAIQGNIQNVEGSHKIKPVLAANWKMNMNLDSISTFVEGFAGKSFPAEVVVCPPAPYLYILHAMKQQQHASFSIGAQNVHSKESGAFTGDVSAGQLIDVGCEYVIIGHSERRAIGECNDFIHKKMKQALAHGLNPILCVGETENERKVRKTNAVVENQVLTALKNISDVSKVIIAYEPVWAIGTGQSAVPEQAQEVHQFIRSVLLKKFGEVARQIPILYGGSAKPDNAREYSAMPDINGLLVGGASLKADDFKQIIQAFC